MEKSYEKKYHRAEKDGWWFRARRDMIIRLLQSENKNIRILDIGCSSGILMNIIRAAGFHEITGIDISAEAIHLAQKNGIANVFLRDAIVTQFADEEFEVVIASDVLEHIVRAEDALAEWYRILKPGGKLMVFVPAHSFLWSRHDESNHHVMRYSKHELFAALEKAGFSLGKKGYWNFLLFFPKYLHRIIFSRASDDLSEHFGLLNTVLYYVMIMENTLIFRGASFPIGVSIFCVAKKKDYRMSHQDERKSNQYEEVIYKRGTYDDLMWQAEKPILLREVSRLKQSVDVITYLDFGCGTGRILQLLEGETNDALGVDISESMVALAREKGVRAPIIVGDITREDIIGTKTFQLITAFRVFLNAGPELSRQILAALVPKLESSGIFIFNMHGNLWSYRFFTKIWYRLWGRQLNTATLSEVRGLVSSHGLTIVRWYGVGIIPKVFFRWGLGSILSIFDRILLRLPGARFIAYDLIFVCKKI